jgi:RNA polymerase sigma factor (sigma-70 family)
VKAPAESTEALCTRALDGERSAWQALIQLHSRRVLVSLLAQKLRHDQAQELVQETWMRLMEQQRLGKLSALSLPALAISQARFLLLDEQRRRKPDASEAAHHDPPDERSNPEERAMSSQQLERLRVRLRACAPSAQKVFRLVYEEQLGHEQVAARVGLSLQRVRQILCELRKELRGAIVVDHV